MTYKYTKKNTQRTSPQTLPPSSTTACPHKSFRGLYTGEVLPAGIPGAKGIGGRTGPAELQEKRGGPLERRRWRRSGRRWRSSTGSCWGTMDDGGAAGYGEAAGGDGTKRRRAGVGLLYKPEAKDTRFDPAGGCQEDGPAVSKRQMVEIPGGKSYPGKIAGNSAKDFSHCEGKLDAMFSDCTMDDFEDDAIDGCDRVEALRARLDSLAVGPKTYITDMPAVSMHLLHEYCDEVHLGRTCKSMRAIIPVAYEIDASKTKDFFHNDPDGVRGSDNMGLHPLGTKLPPRAVKAITVTGCYKRLANDIACTSQVKAFQRVIARAIPTLSSITLEGKTRAANQLVSALLTALVESGEVAPYLISVKLVQSSNAADKAIRVIMQGLWPALRVLEIPQCHLSRPSMTRLATAVREGRLRDLRVLKWDNQGETGRRESNLILEALSTGSCPDMEILSFTKNSRFDHMSLSFLGSALRACSKLRELHMDCAVEPSDQLQQLTNTITSGDAPALQLICLQLKWSGYVGAVVEECKTLENAAKSRRPTPVDVIISVGKTRG
ncbi:unnamed protein product [Scytosiphon promiscuus]